MPEAKMEGLVTCLLREAQDGGVCVSPRDV